MRPIIRWTLWRRRWSIFWWSLGVAGLIILTLAFYPTIHDQQDQLQKSFGKLSNGTVALFSDTKDIFSPTGYLSSQIFYLTLPLVLSVLTIGMGSSLIAREETDGTLELLLARPISRSKLLVAKLLSGLAIACIVATVSATTTVIAVKIVNLSVPLPSVVFATFISLLIALIFGMIAFVVTCLGRRGRGAAVGAASFVALGGYIIASQELNVRWLKWPAKVFPYHYYSPSAILGGQYTWLTASWFMAFILILGIFSWLAFRGRDISA